VTDNPINSPHDRFVRFMLGRPETAISYLKRHLPPDCVAELELSGLRPAGQSFVDQTLRESFSDLVFEVPLVAGGSAMVVILFEHKSYPDPMTAFQVLRYQVRVLEKRARDGLPLCCVIPLVLYHGEHRWNVARTLADLIPVPGPLRRFIPQFDLPLLDLSECPDEDLGDESTLYAMLSVLKYIRSEQLAHRLVRTFQAAAGVARPETALELFEAILWYVMYASKTVRQNELRDSFTQAVQDHRLLSKGLSLMPTIAERLIAQGLEQGLEQGVEIGIEKGRREGTRNGEVMGRIRFVQQVLGRPVSSMEELEGLDAVALAKIDADLQAEFVRR
jgi:predicted transposase/invertase (TIGR01784 family)